MAKRQREWANRAKARLCLALGNLCWACGSPGPLEIDHIHGRDWKPRKVEFSHRISIYRREWAEGKIRLLCSQCNCTNQFLHVELPPPPGVAVLRDGAWQPY